MTSYARIDDQSTLTVVAIDPTDSRHRDVSTLGHVTTTTAATKALKAAGYRTTGAWRQNIDGDTVRTITR